MFLTYNITKVYKPKKKKKTIETIEKIKIYISGIHLLIKVNKHDFLPQKIFKDEETAIKLDIQKCIIGNLNKCTSATTNEQDFIMSFVI
ncbi:hypothetical protein BpHYR1_029242 [Brachionus plicatilis]|uniref:Uncharacterized protein n=1 Tax=Brachionus plicatilis TaxID=10195 RepID=A0A3M7RCB1_BRAPC|nr:hypothetical protein BpHYR1_029242 [Brachionus plicatilis]